MLSRASLPTPWAGGRNADENGCAEFHSLGAHLVQAAVDHAFFELEVGNAVTQQPADAVALLEHGHVVAGTRKLLRAGKPGRAGADDRDLLPGLVRRRLRTHPAFFPGPVHDCMLDRLDADRVLVDTQHARFFAGRRADAAGEFRKVVGRMQHLDRRLPVLPVDQVVPVRDDVADRASRHAERHAAIHAARALHPRRLVGQAQVELAVVLLAGLGGLVRLLDAAELEEPVTLPTHFST